MSTNTNKNYHVIKDNAVKEFTECMTFVINAIYSKNKMDDDIIAIRDGYTVARKENADCIIIQTGPYLWQYRKEIEASNINTLINNEFKEEIEKYQGSLVDVSKFDKIKIIMSKVKRTWHLFNETEKNVMLTKFKKMVALYATYLGTCKAIG